MFRVEGKGGMHMMERWFLHVNVSILSCFYSETLANLVPNKMDQLIYVGPDHFMGFFFTTGNQIQD